MLQLFVTEAESGKNVAAFVSAAQAEDLEATSDWQTDWTSNDVQRMPNKVALHRTDNGELLGLMSYRVDHGSLAVEIIYVESARHSNANLLAQAAAPKKYIGIAKALFGYAIDVSIQSGFDGVLFFKAKTSELVEYYIREFGACHVGSYDPFRLVIWEDAAQKLIQCFRKE